MESYTRFQLDTVDHGDDNRTCYIFKDTALLAVFVATKKPSVEGRHTGWIWRFDQATSWHNNDISKAFQGLRFHDLSDVLFKLQTLIGA